MPTSTSAQDRSQEVLRPPTPTEPVAAQSAGSDVPSFEWTRVPGADGYRVQIAEGKAFDTLYVDDLMEPGSTVSLETALPGDVESVCWRVRAERGDEQASEWSAPAHFRRPGGEPKLDGSDEPVETAPTPRRPAADAPTSPSAAEFTWEKVANASGYRIQIANHDTFSRPLVDLTVDQTTSLFLADRMSNLGSTAYWRVRALSATGDGGPWSEGVAFSRTEASDDTGVAEQESTDGQRHARAAGPVLESHTSRGFSIAVSLFVLLTFIATVVLIAVMS